MSTNPVRPRNAASLIIHRGEGENLEILMGCRYSKARFKPGVYVFPGGMLERSDSKVLSASELNPQYIGAMGVGGALNRAQALAVAAIRETYEEVGLMVASPSEQPVSAHPDWQDFSSRSLAPNLSPLNYIGRAITPAHQPIRFDARFFCVDAKYTAGTIRDNGELTDLRWIKLSDAENYNMMKVTHMMLDRLTAKLQDINAKVPFLYFINDNKRIKWY